MRKIEAVLAFGMWASLVLAVDQVGATQTDWGGQIWSESEWMTEIESEEEKSEWEDESTTDQETETETETERHQIILTNGFVKKTQKTPPEEIALAQKYRADYFHRKESSS